ILPSDYCIMELKADDRVPEWATSLLARHDCQLNRVSKYCAGIATLRDLKVQPLAFSPNVPSLEEGEDAAPNGAELPPPWFMSAVEPSAKPGVAAVAPPRAARPSSEPPHG